jgi:hypothetical protein
MLPPRRVNLSLGFCGVCNRGSLALDGVWFESGAWWACSPWVMGRSTAPWCNCVKCTIHGLSLQDLNPPLVIHRWRLRIRRRRQVLKGQGIRHQDTGIKASMSKAYDIKTCFGVHSVRCSKKKERAGSRPP